MESRRAARTGTIFDYVLDVATKKPLADHLKWINGGTGGGSWHGEEGFFYSRYPAPEKGHELLHQKRISDRLVSQDRHAAIRGRTDLRRQGASAAISGRRRDRRSRFAVLSVSERGKGKNGNALFFRDLSKNEKTFTPIVEEITNDSYSILDDINGKFLIETNHDAPNGKKLSFTIRPTGRNGKMLFPKSLSPWRAQAPRAERSLSLI